MRKILYLFLVLPILMACDQVLGPRSFDDCILKNMRGVTSDVAAANIRRSCREKFSEIAEPMPRGVELSALEIISLTGRAALSYGNRYSGNIYNGNEDITITQVTIKVTTIIGGNSTSRRYATNVTIPPQSTADFAFDIIVGDEGAGYSWSIDSARGY